MTVSKKKSLNNKFKRLKSFFFKLKELIYLFIFKFKD